MANPGDTPRIDTIESTRRKSQIKYLTGDVTSNDTDVSDLHFSNLTIGRIYRVFGQFKLNASGGGDPHNYNIRIYNHASTINGVTTVSIAEWFDDDASSTTYSDNTNHPYVVFTAAETDLKVSASISLMNFLGDATLGESWLRLEDVTDEMLETTDWT